MSNTEALFLTWSQCMVLVGLAPPSALCGRMRGKESEGFRCLVLVCFHQQIHVCGCAHMHIHLYKYVYTHTHTHARMDGGYGSQSVVPSGGKKSAAALPPGK